MQFVRRILGAAMAGWSIVFIVMSVWTMIISIRAAGEAALPVTMLPEYFSVLAMLCLVWVVTTIIPGILMANSGKPQRGWSLVSLASFAAMMGFAWLVRGHGGDGVTPPAWLLFGIPFLSFLDIVLPPWKSKT
ncbi:MAG TPA: hypothetical protein VGE53_00540 [Candidatus Paceibacterota bacterium]